VIRISIASGILFFGFVGSATADVTKEDVRKLVEHGLSDDVILAFIRANGPIDPLSSQDLVELKRAGASDGVVVELLRSKKPIPVVEPPSRAPAPEFIRYSPPTRVVHRQRFVRTCRPRPYSTHVVAMCR